jgi:hypothetical protein
MIWNPLGSWYLTTAPTLSTFRPFALPVSVTLLGLPVAESVMTSEDDFVPDDVGVKVTLMLHCAPLTSVPVQVFAPSVNCVESPVEITTLVKVTDEPL